MAAGMAMSIPSMTGSIMSAVPLGKAGVGSAMNDTTRELGGALGVAVLGSLVASRYDAKLSPALDLLPESLHGQASESLAGALHAGSDVGGTDGHAGRDIAREAYVSGMHLAAIIAGCVACSRPASSTASCPPATRTPRALRIADLATPPTSLAEH